MTKPKPIKASVGFKRTSAGDVVARANAVIAGIFTAKDDYPAPPIAQTALQPIGNTNKTAKRIRYMVTSCTGRREQFLTGITYPFSIIEAAGPARVGFSRRP